MKLPHPNRGTAYAAPGFPRHQLEKNMNLPFNGLWGLIVLVADIWAIVNIFQSAATTQAKVLWILLVLILPVIGFVIWFFAGPKSSR
jgi:hypothetical protein